MKVADINLIDQTHLVLVTISEPRREGVITIDGKFYPLLFSATGKVFCFEADQIRAVGMDLSFGRDGVTLVHERSRTGVDRIRNIYVP